MPFFKRNPFPINVFQRLPLWGSSREAGERANEKIAVPYPSNSSTNPNLKVDRIVTNGDAYDNESYENL